MENLNPSISQTNIEKRFMTGTAIIAALRKEAAATGRTVDEVAASYAREYLANRPRYLRELSESIALHFWALYVREHRLSAWSEAQELDALPRYLYDRPRKAKEPS